MHINLDLIEATIKKMVGIKVRSICGPNLNAYYYTNYSFFQFHKGFLIEGITSEKEKIGLFFNGCIKELASGYDIFLLTIQEETTKKKEFELNFLYPKYFIEKETSDFIIEAVDLYNYKIEALPDQTYPFALVVHCKNNQQFIIRFEFPADGLHLSFDKKVVSSFFENDSLGKQLFLFKSLSV